MLKSPASGHPLWQLAAILYVSTIKGPLQRLNSDASHWEMIGKTPTARSFHRMLLLDETHLLIVGGTNMRIGKFEQIEVLSVTLWRHVSRQLSGRGRSML